MYVKSQSVKISDKQELDQLLSDVFVFLYFFMTDKLTGRTIKITVPSGNATIQSLHRLFSHIVDTYHDALCLENALKTADITVYRLVCVDVSETPRLFLLE